MCSHFYFCVSILVILSTTRASYIVGSRLFVTDGTDERWTREHECGRHDSVNCECVCLLSLRISEFANHLSSKYRYGARMQYSKILSFEP